MTKTDPVGTSAKREGIAVGPTGRGLWLRWLPTFVGFIAGGALAGAVNRPAAGNDGGLPRGADA